MRPAAAKLIYLFVKVDLFAEACAVAQTTQPKSRLSRLPPRLECVISRLRDETIEHYIALTIASSSQILACSNRSSSASATWVWVCSVSTDWLLLSHSASSHSSFLVL